MRIAVLRRLSFAALALAFCVVVFGAYVRLTDAGLGCPDWPGCYGHMTPAAAAAANAGTVEAPLHVGKAWREMIHRYAATLLGALIVLIAVLAARWRRHPGVPLALPLSLVGLVILQGAFGALTVIWKVKPIIVTGHLAFGLLTLSLLWWLWFTLRRRSTRPWSGSLSAHGGGPTAALLRPASFGMRRLALVALAVLVVQILLGGWTSTNYAATACPDFPRCHGLWWPPADFAQGFVPWRGLGINYEGGVLDLPARIAVQLTHRLGAVVATLALLLLSLLTFVRRQEYDSRFAAGLVLAALGLQLAIGISMVLKAFPLWLATAHNAGAAFLLLATLSLNRALRRL